MVLPALSPYHNTNSDKVKKKLETVDYGLYLGHHLSMAHPPLVHHQRLDAAAAVVKQ